MTKPNPKATNARFWYLINDSPVKLTLRPGQELDWYSYRKTDEGYHADAQVWRHTRERVVCVTHMHARDCDGRFDSSSEVTCEISELRSGEVDGAAASDYHGNPIVYPAWQDGESSQRDHSAEAMGY